MANETVAGLTRFDPLAGGYEGWFESPLGAFVARLEREMILKLLRPQPRERLLEVGCGTGFFLRDIAATGTSCVGIDPSREMLSVAESRPVENVSYLQACAEALPFRNASFDGVLFFTTLEFVQDDQAAVLEAARVVRSGGRLAFGVLNAEGPWAESRRREGGLWAETRFYRRSELESLLRPLGELTVDYCVHVPPQLGRLPRAVLDATDYLLRRAMPRSGALIGMRVDLGRK
jgi:ubiquinone/menaquinone biosynthesis C-methylase UbiE